MGIDQQSLLATARHVAGEAAALVREASTGPGGHRRIDVATKSSETDVVTSVDRASEQRIRELLARLRPGEPMLGEEAATATGAAPCGEASVGPDSVTWVVDPIDGTVNFLYGYPAFAVSVAAQVEGRSVAGAVIEPMTGRCWSATRGGGAWLDGVRLRVSAPARLGVTLLATGFAYDAARRQRQARMITSALGNVRDIRRSGSAALDLCAVATGWVDAYCEHGLSRWDWAAGALIAEEAGATLSLPGDDPRLGADATLACAPSVADEVAELLVHCGAAEV
ncbi:inositol monophosphatase family protein [Haloechinothrix sp. LS1_15]|uniref:inositol monophosphatase family protein n=1 Tax=Haloechinothrix sp. LS1_15 TaxID=2652248 RepID=UPI002944265A|nr:inositol monophosphatase family protein [Haloechinothrix sp. LS1_15]MDV6014462.1 inositol monophosphatase [Haloechinothrix sp. LS1_15]